MPALGLGRASREELRAVRTGGGWCMAELVGRMAKDQKLRVSSLLYSEVRRGCISPIPTKQTCPVRPWRGCSPAYPPSQSTFQASGSLLRAEAWVSSLGLQQQLPAPLLPHISRSELTSSALSCNVHRGSGSDCQVTLHQELTCL